MKAVKELLIGMIGITCHKCLSAAQARFEEEMMSRNRKQLD